MPDDPIKPAADAGDGRAETHPPIPRDKRGWRVAPAPDGRGMPEQAPSRPPPHRRPVFLWLVVALLALNWIALLVSEPSGRPRVRVPFDLTLLQEVKCG